MVYNLQTLITILEQILDPQQTCFIHDHNKPQLKSLLEKAISLQQILEKHPLPNIEISLEREIRGAAYKAEDIIESHMVNRMLSNASETEELLASFSSADLQQVTQQLDSAAEQVVKLVEAEAGNKMMVSSRGSSSSSGGASLNPKSVTASGSIMVGFDEDLEKLKERLVVTKSKLEIVPIVGMGGAGKTTLARKLYEDPLIFSHFVARAWATVSQDFDMRTILLSLLSCIIGKDQLKELIDRHVIVNELKDILRKSLFGRRYLIVLDDIWSTKVWDEVRMYFPETNNGSRVVITTRETNVAKYANSTSRQHEVQLLSESASWNLLCQIVFGEDRCPNLELELIGKKMASDCGGLPLAITVIGGLLSKVERSKDVWESIGENIRAAIAKSDKTEQYSNIMSLSYKHLPNYLKPCFLYMGAFPEDYEIEGSRLKCLWIAEGFVKSNRDKSLEEEAEDYLKGLVERNLLMVRRKKLHRKTMSYIIHDVLRDLCIRKANEDNFLHVIKMGDLCIRKADDDNFLHIQSDLCIYMKAYEDSFLHVIKNENAIGVSKLRRVSSHDSHGKEEMYVSTEVMSLARTFLCNNWSEMVVRCVSSVSNLLRVLDIINESFIMDFPKEILLLVNLRYLGISCDCLHVGISRLVNLQTLIVNLYSDTVPSEIWTMSGLRHLKLNDMIQWSEDDIKTLGQMNNLQTISKYLVLTESLYQMGLLQTIPNIKDLGLYREGDFEIDLSHLHKLETLRYNTLLRTDGCRFPPTLRNLTLTECRISRGMERSLCGLPHLEVLKFSHCEFEKEEWKSGEGEKFRSLQLLQLHSYNLVHWRADETNFPKLRHLYLEYCPRLEKIPCGIGEIPTLELIEILECSTSGVESAKQILEEQQSEYGNYTLQFRIHGDDDA